MGIVHQVNLEHLATVVMDDGSWIYPDSLVGTDSHTTMINGLGVVGWGVGGIEAEAVMLGQAVSMVLPEVIGMRLTGELPKEATATDMVLRITELLRAEGVVSKFVEFFGPGLTAMPLANRATIANMAPEYGATMGFFPVDERTIDYMRATGRSEALCATVEECCKAQGLWHDPQKAAKYTKVLELDLATVQPALAGPRRPQDRVDLSDMQNNWRDVLAKEFSRDAGECRTAEAQLENGTETLRDGSVVIAAITSCTNLEPFGNDGRRPVGSEAGGPRSTPEALGEDIPCPRLPSRDQLLGICWADGWARISWIPYRRLRLHHMHREFWSTSGSNSRCHPFKRSRGLLRSLREPELRRSHRC